MTHNGHGICRVCGRPYRLTRDGYVRRHWARNADGSAASGLPDCDGSGEPPSRRPGEDPQ